MTQYARLQIKHVSFVGPNKPAAVVHFKSGFIVLYGASTPANRLFSIPSIMLGGKGPLRDFPEREGYDRILFGMQVSVGEFFTLQRSTAGGGFLKADGLHEETFLKDGVISCASSMMSARTITCPVSSWKQDRPTRQACKANKHNETNSLSF